MSHFEYLTEEMFSDLFKPIANHLNPHASFDWGEGFGTLYETYDEELDYVRQHRYSNIWTLVSGDGGDFIASGFHFVNRLGYFITKVAVPDNCVFEVPLLDIGDDEDEVLTDHSQHSPNQQPTNERNQTC